MSADAREEAEAQKQRGNALLKEGRFAEAEEAYSLAIAADPETAALWSNRSAARLKAGQAAGALADAEEAVSRKPGWTKGYHRKASALQALGRPREAASACQQGVASAAAGTEEGELKELRRLAKQFMVTTGELALQASCWHGKVSPTLGAYEQEFHFKPERAFSCHVYGNEVLGTYTVADVEDAPDGLRGGVDVVLDGSKVPYLFRLGSDGVLHLCCPMSSTNERPRTFQGPGYVEMRPGAASGEETTALANLPDGERILRYLGELADIMEARPDAASSGGGAAERLQESGDTTLSANQVFGQQSLEEQAKQMAHQQQMSALRVKYTGEIEDAAQKLISGEAKEEKLYPEQAEELERVLRRFGRSAAPQKPAAVADAAPAAEPPGGAEVKAAEKPAAAKQAAEPAKAETEATAPVVAAKAAPAAAAGKAAAPKPAKGSCWQACFAGLQRGQK